jgi:wobble nucleotide-excising tRNase
MITDISIAGCASYISAKVLRDLSKFNFIYGSNGTGKTTISRVIADDQLFPTCSVTWKGGTRLQTMVYNRDFITKNFNQPAGLKGIFTLGEKSTDTLAEITATKAAADSLSTKIEGLTKTLKGEDDKGGKEGELADLKDWIKEKCWKQKQKHDEKLLGAFEGFRNNAENFKNKVLYEKTSNPATVEPLADLEKRAETMFGPAPTPMSPIIALNTVELVAHESNSILSKRVIGRADVDIAAMIRKLSNSDWVKQGRAFYVVNDKRCPFCQQITPDALAQSLNEYFDETFEKDSKAIETLEINYKTSANSIRQRLDSILDTPCKYLDVIKLKSKKDLIDSKITLNLQQIAKKKKEPSQSIALESLAYLLSEANEVIANANEQINSHNTMVANLKQEQIGLKAQVWKYLLEEELKDDLAYYDSKLNERGICLTQVAPICSMQGWQRNTHGI